MQYVDISVYIKVKVDIFICLAHVTVTSGASRQRQLSLPSSPQPTYLWQDSLHVLISRMPPHQACVPVSRVSICSPYLCLYRRRGEEGKCTRLDNVHILAYFGLGGLARWRDLEACLTRIREGRYIRARQMVATLCELGAPVKWENVMKVRPIFVFFQFFFHFLNNQ